MELGELRELALDLRWSWNHSADRLWNAINAEVWRATGNAWLVLLRSSERLRELSSDRTFLREVQQQVEAHRRYLEREAIAGVPRVAFFSMEFGLSEALPFYAGGLGILAGDYLKTASDVGAPIIGVGLLYRQGYFQQRLDAREDQEELYVAYEPEELPIQLVRGQDGAPRSVAVELPGRIIRLLIWEARVGRTRLYLLDSVHPDNVASDRAITSRLYPDNAELRLSQEIVLGVGGMRALDLMGLEPEILHLNEGHAAFAVLERAELFMKRNGLPFEAALRCTRAGTIFTTHTAVAAAFDRFPVALIEPYLSPYATALGTSVESLLRLGQTDDPNDAFTMPWLAVRGAGAVNAVSILHEDVSRRLFAPLFPRWPIAEILIGHVTNGVHTDSWDSEAADAFWTSHELVSDAADETLWALRREQRVALTRRLGRFDPDTLVVGFARRFTKYKRGALLLNDPGRLARLLRDPERPVQLIVAGKAHPSDEEGKETIHRWLEFVERPDVRERAVFVPDYDLAAATMIIEGVDVWLNMPMRRWEACGTSGMKALINGGLNCSTLDGWWDEAYDPDLGWAIGGRDGSVDAADAESLYRLLEEQIVPDFYAREGGMPKRWIARMRRSMGELVSRYSTDRMLHEYIDRLYRPVAQAYQRRSARRGESGAALEASLTDLAARWGTLRIDRAEIEAQANGLLVKVAIALGSVKPDEIAVELYADPEEPGSPPERHSLALDGGFIVTRRPANDYTVRIIPRVAEATIPLEFERIVWER